MLRWTSIAVLIGALLQAPPTGLRIIEQQSMAIADANNSNTNDGSASMAYPNAMQSGGFLIAIIRRGGSGSQPSGVSDGRNGAWTKAFEQLADSSDHTLAVWYKENGGSGSAVTVTQTGGSGTNRWMIEEFTGLATSSSLDQSSGGTFGGAPADSGDITTTQADELLIGAVSTTGSDTVTPPVNWTELAETSSKVQGAYRILAATGTHSYEPTYDSGLSSGACLIVSFKAPGGGGGGGTKPWYAYAQQRIKTQLSRRWERNGILWTPAYVR